MRFGTIRCGGRDAAAGLPFGSGFQALDRDLASEPVGQRPGLRCREAARHRKRKSMWGPGTRDAPIAPESRVRTHPAGAGPARLRVCLRPAHQLARRATPSPGGGVVRVRRRPRSDRDASGAGGAAGSVSVLRQPDGRLARLVSGLPRRPAGSDPVRACSGRAPGVRFRSRACRSCRCRSSAVRYHGWICGDDNKRSGHIVAVEPSPR